MIHVPGGMEWNGVGFHRATQNGAPLRTYELFISTSYFRTTVDYEKVKLWRAKALIQEELL